MCHEGRVHPVVIISAQTLRTVVIEGSPDTEGGVRITSEPSGAEVEIDGRIIGETPTRPLVISEGTHAVLVRRIGYSTWGGQIEFESNTFNIQLERDPTEPKITFF